MKSLSLTILVFLFFFINVFGQQQPMELVFSAQNYKFYSQLDSVLIENHTQTGDTMLYFPDTVLFFDMGTGVHNEFYELSGFEITQNYPNPIAGQTQLSVMIAQKAKTFILVTDLTGRKLLEQQRILEQGEHHFTFTPGTENFYILTVKANNYQKSIKMINDPFHSPGSECKLNYTGNKSVIPQHKSSSGKGDFVFTPGDLLIYTGYADSTERKISDRPMDDQYYVFQFNGEPCPETPYVWDIDGNVYNTVKIFGQCWMKENLKTTTYSYGMPVINATDSVWATTTAGAYAWYNNDPGLSYAYGALYNGYAVGGLCPEGWSVPTVQQFEAMKNHIQGTSTNTVAQYLKACRQKNYAWGMCNADTHPRWEESIAHHGVDSYGFTGMPGGARFPDGSFDQVGYYCYWWTSSVWGYDQVFWYMIYSQDPLHFYQYGRNHGFSIRCIKNTEETE